MMGESSSIDIEHLIEHLSEKVLPTSNPSSLSTCYIFRVDERLRKLNEDAYTPDTLSIGPYHRDVVKKNLQMRDMEDLKERYVKALLDRTRETASLKSYVEALKELETDPKTAPSKCYSEPINNLNNKEDKEENFFLEMMLTDGLFIIELFRKHSHVVPVDDDDPIFHSNLRRSRIVRDLVLLENQIPMSVLEKLFELSKSDSDIFSLIHLALIFFKDLIPDGLTTCSENPKHLLDLLSYTFAPQKQESSTKAIEPEEALKQLESLPCATELRRSGINFKGSGHYSTSLNMKFSKGKFEIPTLRVDDLTDCVFRNLIAYEQQSFAGRHHMTSYALLMDHLIDTVHDVTLLHRRGIIMNHLGDNEKVSSLFNKLCREISSDGNKFCYGTLCMQLNEYHNRRCHRWKAYFKRKYCNSPWACISFVAAILALFLTLCSTVLAALPFFGVKDFIYTLDNGQQAIGSIIGASLLQHQPHHGSQGL